MQILLLILGFLALGNSIYAGNYIAIHGRAIKLTSSTKCIQLDTADPQDICDCCLLKYKITQNKKDNQALQICQNKGECSLDLALSPAEALESARKNLTLFGIVDATTLPLAPKIPYDGLLTTDTVLEILLSLTQSNSSRHLCKIL